MSSYIFRDELSKHEYFNLWELLRSWTLELDLELVGTLTKLDFRVELKICGNSYEVGL